ncbi:heterokaryon incompatibility protein-domain-containing protein [Cercophora newfieldiana]|uniref:Heterokaryon incompatibility protein-domain-containing protein n=1 Tax=Cercophora newfieldiana TaxID=92897 RepID=A0AA39Y1K9_9PEZI|nr:heterokaryon incompatibility protein-domain-containing protein [Cercophora newfieldiana]
MPPTSLGRKQAESIQAPPRLSYDTLPKGPHIRLLQIAQASKNLTSETLSVHLTAFPLDKAPRFWALSYTWGPPRYGADYEHYKTDRKTIKCNGVPAEIGQNLHDFLTQAHRLRLFVHQNSAADSNVPDSEEPFLYLSRLKEFAKKGGETPDDDDRDGGADLNLPPLALSPTTATSQNSSNMEPPQGRTAYLWIDALCIDQENTHEKSLQVGFMDVIYGRAERVLIWLGPREPNEDVLWALEEFVPSLYRMVSQDTQGAYKKKSLSLTDHVFTRSLGEESCERWRMSLFALISFFSRSCWFSRGWVAQEAFALPVDSVAVLAGAKPIRFEQVLQLTSIFDHYFSFSDILPMLARQKHKDPEDETFWPDSGTMSNLRRFPLIQYHLARHASTDRPWEAILGLLDKMSALQFADGRDHVYGCLGLIKSMVGPLDGLMVPDYRLTAREVLMNTAEMIIRNIPELDVLFSFVGRHDGYQPTSGKASDIPSWVPDFTRPKRENTLYRSLKLNTGPCSTAPRVGSNRDQTAELRGDTLFVKGARLDVVSDSIHIGPTARRRMRGDWLLGYMFRSGCYPFGGQARERALLETLAAGSEFEASKSLSVAESARDWFALTLSTCYLEEDDVEEHFSSKLKNVRESRPWLPTSDMVTKMMGLDDAVFLGVRNRNDWHQLTKTNLVGRAILETDDGYLVLGPRAAKSGDEIWVVKGSRLPVILRKSKKRKGYYSILGVVYVHGLVLHDAMNGLGDRMKRIGLV